jgi:glycosyltransferase involved in cell wall biosynthesis
MSSLKAATVLLSAYACCPDRGSEPRYGWNYLLLHARVFRRVILVTSVQDHARVAEQLAAMDIRNVKMVVVRLGKRLDRLHDIPVGGIHLHYYLWLRAARNTIRTISDHIDFAHHVTYGSLQFGSPLYELSCPFIFGPVGGGQVTNKVFYPLMGNAKYTERVRNLVSALFYRFNPFFKGTMARASLIYCSNRETWAATMDHLPPGHGHKLKMMVDTVVDDRFLDSAPPARTAGENGLSALWVGRLIPRKGIEVLLNVALLLKDQDFTLTMAGDGPMREKVLRFIRKNGLEKTVHFVGQVDQPRLLDLYRKADLLLFLSYRDSVGLQIAEAFSQGVPVLSFDQFGASTLITPETGIRIPAQGTIEEMQAEIAAAVRLLGSQPERLAQMSRNAAAYARQFSWSQRMEDLLLDIKPLLHQYEQKDPDLRLERV